MDDCDSDANPERTNNVFNCFDIKIRHDPCTLW